MNVLKYFVGASFSYARRCNIYFKNKYYKKKYRKIDPSVRIGYETILESNKNNIEIGKKTYLQRNCQIVGNVKIGKYCSIASNTNIWANTHSEKRGSKQSVTKEGEISIGDFCWIGSNVFIRENVKIGNKCIIGANSVVTKNFPDNSMIAGVPAKKIGEAK